jgi:hypothetical protein
MSDVNIAPPALPSAPSAPANEVPINQNPVANPQPVGDQAPEKPVDGVDRGHGRPETRRESIRKAFERANTPEKERTPAPRKADQKAAKAERAEKATEPGLDLRKPPQDRYREGGRFARAPEGTATPQADPAVNQQPQQTARKPSAPLPETAPYREPPGRWNEAGKAEWSAAPESVRGEVYRMAKEFDGAYKTLRGDHDTMNTIRHFHEMATQHGTTLDKALNNYVSMEQKLRTDLVGGLDVIVNNLNLRTSDGRKLGLRDVAYHILNQSPEQHKLIQQQNSQQAAQSQIGSLHREVEDLKSTIQQLHTGLQFNHTRSQVDVFADSHPGFDELGDLIEQELHFGFSLEEAYQRAARLRPPTTRAAQTRNTPAQTRPDKSISGAPDTGPSDGQRRRSDKPVGRREAIQRAIQRVNGGV